MDMIWGTAAFAVMVTVLAAVVVLALYLFLILLYGLRRLFWAVFSPSEPTTRGPFFPRSRWHSLVSRLKPFAAPGLAALLAVLLWLFPSEVVRDNLSSWWRTSAYPFLQDWWLHGLTLLLLICVVWLWTERRYLQRTRND